MLCLTPSFDLAEKSGKTIHLLKAKSKPIQSGRKKKKLPMLGTFQDFKDSKKKPMPTPPVPNLPSGPTQLFPNPARPPQGSIQQLFANAGDTVQKEAKMKNK